MTRKRDERFTYQFLCFTLLQDPGLSRLRPASTLSYVCIVCTSQRNGSCICRDCLRKDSRLFETVVCAFDDLKNKDLSWPKAQRLHTGTHLYGSSCLQSLDDSHFVLPQMTSHCFNIRHAPKGVAGAIYIAIYCQTLKSKVQAQVKSNR